MAAQKSSPIYDRIRRILESARSSVARSVNTTQVMAHWLIGREIVEEEQRGRRRADYGSRLLIELSSRLQADFGKGFSVNNLEHFRDFYLTYPRLITPGNPHALRVKLADNSAMGLSEISHAPRGKSRQSTSWTPGRLHPNLSWTHYRTLLRVDELRPARFTRSRQSRTTGPLASWSDRKTACCTSGWL